MATPEAVSSRSATHHLRNLPSVDRLLQLPETADLVAYYGRRLTTDALRAVLAEARRSPPDGQDAIVTDAALVASAAMWLTELLAPTLRPVINATGVVLHTNLGRAPLSRDALAAVQVAAAAYSTLEYDIESGTRGSRSVHAERLLMHLTGAEAALVVNNNAAAILLMLSALCAGREVIISRGQLVEIGGGFRIPDVLAQSGARLVEVGTTNRTYLRDYRAAIGPDTAAILVVHYSNYRITGFTAQPAIRDMAALAHEHGLPLLFDQGSGALTDVGVFGLPPETTVPDALRDGADVVAFSGDKLLGGPQAGILCGRATYIAAMKQHPLARAVRADKLCLAALQATLAAYARDTTNTELPVWRMISRPAAELQKEAERWVAYLTTANVPATVLAAESRVGGGSLPNAEPATYVAAVGAAIVPVEALAAALRAAPVPVIGRIADGRLLLDPRTVTAEEAGLLLETVRGCYGDLAGED